MKGIFFDTYAFFEVLNGNQNFQKYMSDSAIYTTKLNLMELHYGLIKTYGQEVADKLYDENLKYVTRIDNAAFKSANVMRYRLRAKRLSYIDCVGYMVSLIKGIPFLTGDIQFKGLKNVEFVR